MVTKGYLLFIAAVLIVSASGGAKFARAEYVHNDPINRLDPTGDAQVCATATGSNVPSCVGVDGNGDGNVKDNDLTSNQKARLSSDFRGFILNHAGENISAAGKAVEADSGVSSDAITMSRTVSQFVGTAAQETGGSFASQWSRVSEIALPSADDPRYQLSAPSQLSSNNAILINPAWTRSPSNLARIELHETGHVGQPQNVTGMVLNLFVHQMIDTNARRILMRSGLGGGGCVASGGFPGC